MRLIYKAGVATTAGYGAYIVWYQAETSKQIVQRQLQPADALADPTRRFASMQLHGRYVNPFMEYRHQTVFEFVFRRVQELFQLAPRGDVPKDKRALAEVLLTSTPSWDVLQGRDVRGVLAPQHRMTFTWIGQSCAFVQFPGKRGGRPVNLLTDPMFAESVVSPHVGPQRLIAPPCTVDEIPPIDVVLVSHDHQDHLDFAAAERIGNTATWVVPIGVRKHLEQQGVTNLVEMDWWQKIPLPNVDPALGYEVACTPSMHWSGRTLIDANRTLWCSFLVLRHGKPLFFHGGDSGYAEGLFSGIAKVYGEGCELAMVPCGAYTPQWHLKSQHMNPAEAVQVMKDLGAKNMVGVHWGTFIMSEEPYTEPRQLLQAAAKAMDASKHIIAPDFGRTLTYKV